MALYARITLFTLVFIIGAITARGQSASESTVLQKPGMSAESGKIKFLEGSYTTTTFIPPMPSMSKGATGKGTTDISWALDSMFLMVEEESFNSLLGHYKGHGMLGYESQTHQYVLSMFNNFGDHPTYRGSFAGDTLILLTKVPAPQGAFDQKLLWYRDGDAVKLTVLNDFGKGFLPAIEETSTPVSHKAK